MGFLELNGIPEREIVPGYRARFIHSENITLAYWDVDPGAELPDHSHPHEQMGLLLEGDMEFVIGDERHLLKPGQMWRIPGGVPHSAIAQAEPVKALDVFHPIREDYR